LFVHGEGLCITGRTEDLVTWNYPIFASEDLVFGEKAADLGLKWGFFHEYIQLTSPWTFGAFLRQRRRWLWGNIHAIARREVMSLLPAIMVSTRYVLSFLTYTVSATAVALILGHVISVSPFQYALFQASFVAWLLGFAFTGWVNSEATSGQNSKGFSYIFHRSFQTIMAVLLCPLTASWAVIVLVITFFMGNPRRFEVIAKTGRSS
jgi:hypothetical protein